MVRQSEPWRQRVADFRSIIEARGRGTMQETMGIRLVEATAEHIVMAMPFRPEVAQLTGLFHTGSLLTLADGAATVACLYALDPSGEQADTPFPLAVQVSANLIRNTGSGTATAEAKVVHKGRTTMVVETSVRDDEGRLLVLATTTHVVLQR